MEQKSPKENGLLEWYDSLVFALVVIVVIFIFVMRVITVQGKSMEPQLQGGDRIAVQSMFYQLERGDIVVVDGFTDYGDPLVKRIIAIGGDKIDIDFSTGEVFINDELIHEPYIAAPTTTHYDVAFPLTVPYGCVFVMGDNRPKSLDSRSSSIGFIDERDILGKVLFRAMPFGLLEDYYE